MHDIPITVTAVTHQIYGHLLRAVGTDADDRDRGAVSLEQVLWFVAAGVSVAVIAAILWGKIRTEANRDVVTPSGPGG